MQGRLESELKYNSRIERKLKDMPEFVSDWHRHLKAEERTGSTRLVYISNVFDFLFRCVNRRVIDIKPSDITKESVESHMICVQTTRKDIDSEYTYTSDSYKITIWYTLNNLLKYLASNNLIEKNYMEDIAKPKNKDLGRINANRKLLTKDDFTKIMTVVKSGVYCMENLVERDICLMEILIITGMRKTALTEINIEDIDFENECIHVVDKGNIKHEYTLPYTTMSHIEEWLDVRKTILRRADATKKNALFISNRGQRMASDNVDYIVKKYTEVALGEALSPHKIRAGFCSVLYEETKDVEFVRRAVGHSNIATTQRYIVTGNSEKEKAANIMSSLFN